MATTTRSDIPGYDIIGQLDDLRNPVFKVRKVDGDDLLVAKILGPQHAPRAPGLRNKTSRRLAKILDTTLGWVAVSDHGQASDGQAFIVSPFYHSGSLADRLDGVPEPWADAVRWVTGASLTVGNLHDDGISLGQLRPSAILLSDLDEPHVSLYGLATRRFDDGTFRFEAPEVTAGQSPTPASDTYSLGLILTTLINGRTPEFGEPLEDFIAELEHACPHDIKAVVSKSLSEDPAQRYDNGTTFGHSVRAAAHDATADQIAEATGEHRTITEESKPLSLASRIVPPTAGPAGDRLGVSAQSQNVAPVSLPDDVMKLATETVPLDDWTEAPTVPPLLPPTPVSSRSTSNSPGSIAAEDVLRELGQLVDQAPKTPPSTEGQRPQTKTPANPPSDDSLDFDLEDIIGSRAPQSVTATGLDKDHGEGLKHPGSGGNDHEDSADSALAMSSVGAPFVAQPTTAPRRHPTPTGRLETLSLRLAQFWFSNRRSVATLLASSAVLLIAGIAGVLAFQNFQDERVATAEGAPVPTTERIVVADLNNDISFVTEPPQVNTTTTTTRPPRTTAKPPPTTAAAKTTTTAEAEADDDEPPAEDLDADADADADADDDDDGDADDE